MTAPPRVVARTVGSAAIAAALFLPLTRASGQARAFVSLAQIQAKASVVHVAIALGELEMPHDAQEPVLANDVAKAATQRISSTATSSLAPARLRSYLRLRQP